MKVKSSDLSFDVSAHLFKELSHISPKGKELQIIMES